MAQKISGLKKLGFVTGESGNQYSVTLTPNQHIVVVSGAGCEWRWPLFDYHSLHPEHSVLFNRVRELLHTNGIL